MQAAVGVAVLSQLQEMGIEPEEIEGMFSLYQTLSSDGIDPYSFINIALVVDDVCKRTGLSIEELDVKVSGLEESAKKLEPLAEEVSNLQAQLTELENNRQELIGKVDNLEKRNDVLEASIKDKEQRDIELSNLLIELEDRVQDADKKLATARTDLKILSDVGISSDDLSGFTQRLQAIAHRHSIQSEDLCNHLLKELEQLDEGLGLETMIQCQQNALRNIEENISKAEDKSVAIDGENKVLKKENTVLKAEVETEKEQIMKALKSINMSTKNTISEFKKELQVAMSDSFAEVNKLRNQSLTLGKELGQFTEIIESNEWLRSLQALVRNENAVEPEKVRAIAMMVLRRIHEWLENKYHGDYSLLLLKTSIRNLIGEVEKWKP